MSMCRNNKHHWNGANLLCITHSASAVAVHGVLMMEYWLQVVHPMHWRSEKAVQLLFFQKLVGQGSGVQG